MKKFLVTILTVLLLAAWTVLPAAAADGTVSVTSVSATPGETVTLTVSLEGFEKAASLAVDISAEGLSFQSGKWLISGVLTDVSKNNAAWTPQSAAVVNGEILELTYQLPTRTMNPSYSVTVTVYADGSATGVTATGTVSCAHEYKTTVHAPTCTNLGYTTYACVYCGDTNNGEKTDFVNALQHDYCDHSAAEDCATCDYCEYKAATADEAGYINRTCQRENCEAETSEELCYQVTVKVNDVTVKMGADMPSFTYTVTEGEIPDGSEFGLAYSCETKDTATAGTYTISASYYGAPAHWVVTVENGTLTVKKDKTYNFGQSYSVRVDEPWALRTILNVYPVVNGEEGAKLTQEDFEELDYGVYFLRASDTTKNLEDLTVEDFTENELAVCYCKDSATQKAYVREDGSVIADFTDGIYADQLNESIYTLYYVKDNGDISYSNIKERNLIQCLNERIELANEDKVVLNVYQALVEFEKEFREYREANNIAQGTRADFQKAPTLAEYSMSDQYEKFNQDGDEGRYFTYSKSITLVEPWSIKLNTYINNDTTEYSEYGYVVFYDKENKYSEDVTVEQLLAEKNAYVFSTKNGDIDLSEDENGRKKFTMIYNKEIYTYHLDKNLYAMSYVFDGTNYYYGSVRKNVMMDILNAAYSNMDQTGDDVLDAMKKIYESIVAYRSK